MSKPRGPIFDALLTELWLLEDQYGVPLHTLDQIAALMTKMGHRCTHGTISNASGRLKLPRRLPIARAQLLHGALSDQERARFIKGLDELGY